MQSRIRQYLGGGLAALALVAAPALAHHGWSGNNQEFQLTGTVVTAVNLSGPHGTMQVEDADGQLWDITLAPGPRTHRAGLQEGVVPVGAEVTLHGMRNDDPDRYEMKTRRVVWQDQTFDVYPPS